MNRRALAISVAAGLAAAPAAAAAIVVSDTVTAIASTSVAAASPTPEAPQLVAQADLDAGPGPATPADPAPADDAPPITGDSPPGEIADAALGAALGGEWVAALMLMIAFLVGVARTLWDPLKTRWGGWGANLAASSLVLAGLALLAGEPLTWRLAVSSITLALTMAGGVQVVRDVRASGKG